MQHQTLLILATVIALSSNVNAEGPSFEDGELELLEIDIVESVCNDSAFRSEVGETVGNCAKKALKKLGACSKTLHAVAPRDDLPEDPRRLSKAAFKSTYADCLKQALRQ